MLLGQDALPKRIHHRHTRSGKIPLIARHPQFAHGYHADEEGRIVRVGMLEEALDAGVGVVLLAEFADDVGIKPGTLNGHSCGIADASPAENLPSLQPKTPSVSVKTPSVPVKSFPVPPKSSFWGAAVSLWDNFCRPCTVKSPFWGLFSPSRAFKPPSCAKNRSL